MNMVVFADYSVMGHFATAARLQIICEKFPIKRVLPIAKQCDANF